MNTITESLNKYVYIIKFKNFYFEDRDIVAIAKKDFGNNKKFKE